MRAFINGETSIPVEPRQSSPATLTGVLPPVDGSPLVCRPGDWSGAPNLTFVFQTDTEVPQVRQSGAANAYVPTRALLGQQIVCLVLAANAGGTATARTGSTSALAADTVRPRSRITSRRCRRRTCILRLQAVDPNSHGALRFEAIARYRKSGRRKSRRMTVTRVDGIRFRAVVTKLPYTRVQFTVRAIDAGGNRQRHAVRVGVRVRRR